MSELPSFHTGGAAWFMVLSAADPLYIMPLLSGATFLATVEVCACASSAYRREDALHRQLTHRERGCSWARQTACRATRRRTT